MKIEACAMELPKWDKHPNRLPFLGVLTFADETSEQSPRGCRGHRIIVRRSAIVAAMPSLIGMGVNISLETLTHQEDRKVGIITHAKMIGNRLVVRGILYASDVPALVKSLRKMQMGMSMEAGNCRCEDLRAAVWDISKMTFTGASVLPAIRAAYRKSRFWLARSV